MTPSGGVFLIAWIAAWFVVGFAILPYLTIVPARWLYRAVQELSTAEFVTAVVGLLLGLLMGLLLGLPLSQLEGPRERGCRSACRCSSGWAWSGSRSPSGRTCCWLPRRSGWCGGPRRSAPRWRR